MQRRKARTAGESEGVLDVAHLERATFGDRALRREVLALFDRQAAEFTAAIADVADPDVRARTAHRLRGAALGVGADAVAEAAAAYEARPEDAGLLARLNVSVTEARAAVAALLARD